MLCYDRDLTSVHVEVKDIICLCKHVSVMAFQSTDRIKFFIQMLDISPGAVSSTSKEIFYFLNFKILTVFSFVLYVYVSNCKKNLG